MPDDGNSRMVDILKREGVLKSEKVINAFLNVPRGMFVMNEHADNAYVDYPLPLMKGATISQPSTVALMLEWMDIHDGDRILEIGTGSGWNAALMGHCVGKRGKVISLEIEETLAEFAKQNISKVNGGNVTVICKDGSKGHIEEAPYDRIVYTAAVNDVPVDVLDQLKIGGVLLAPIGTGNVQVLTVIRKEDRNKLNKRYLGYFQFVPMHSK